MCIRDSDDIGLLICCVVANVSGHSASSWLIYHPASVNYLAKSLLYGVHCFTLHPERFV